MAEIYLLILRRLFLGLLVLFVVSVIIFSAVEMLPGDLAEQMLGQASTAESAAALRKELGLDRPPVERYIGWLGNTLQGDFGKSIANGREISELIGVRLGNTLFLAMYAALISIPLALTLGVLSALYRGSIFDRAVNTFTLSSISLPEFFIAYILISVLARSGYFPAISNVQADTEFVEKIYRTFLPALTLTLVVTAHMLRMTRAAIINLLASPYIEMARLKGLSPFRVIFMHALPNALAPIINVVALNLAYLITAVVLVEVVFVYPGLGALLVDSVAKRDFTVVQASSLIFATAYILLNLLADVLSTLSNPRLMHKK